MKKILSLVTILLLTSQAYSLVGIGAYGDLDLLKYPGGTSGDGDSRVDYTGFDNANGFGIMFYIDAIPIIDLEADIEFVGNIYKYTPYVVGDDDIDVGEMPWGRVSTYFTARKKIFGVSIPFLAKAQLYGGLGFNKHTVLPVMTVEIIEAAFGGTADALAESTSDEDKIQKLADYMLDNADKISGFHLQTGVQGKLLFLNAFVNARYTIAKDVIPGKSGFPSIWAGLALGI